VEAQRQIRAQASLAVVPLAERQTTTKVRASSAAVTPEAEIRWVLLAQLVVQASVLLKIRADNRQIPRQLGLVEQATPVEAVCLAM